MNNSLVLFDVKSGFLIDGKVAIIYGTGSPDGSDIDKVGIGSLYLSETDGSVFKKHSLATGPQSWTRISEVPKRNTVLSGIESETIIDQEYTSDVTSLTWQVVVADSADPQLRRTSTISCLHDGTLTEVANFVNYEEHGILYSKVPSPNSLLGVQFKVDLFGEYPTQVFQLSITPAPNTSVDIVSTRLVLIPEDNVTTTSFGEASHSVLGLVRLANDAEIDGGVPQSVVTGEGLKNKLTKLLVMGHSPVILVTDPTVRAYDFAYNKDFVQVFLNRLKLRPTEYEATNGSSIRFLIDLEVNDEIEVCSIPNY